jgi:ATP diphosphatase
VTEGEVRRGANPGPVGRAGASAPAPSGTEAAVGELLFAAVALARRLRVNPEDALRAPTRNFADRFRRLETQARADGVDLHDLDATGWRQRWEATSAPQ